MDKIAMMQAVVDKYRQDTAVLQKEAGVAGGAVNFVKTHPKVIERLGIIGGTLGAATTGKSVYRDWNLGRQVRRNIEAQRDRQAQQ